MYHFIHKDIPTLPMNGEILYRQYAEHDYTIIALQLSTRNTMANIMLKRI